MTVYQTHEPLVVDQALMWISNPIDSRRPHEIDSVTKWHARLMSLAWSIIFPVSILIARFYKVMPQQKFPEQIDSQWWWITHRICAVLGTIVAILAFSLVYFLSGGEVSVNAAHRYAGWTALVLLSVQIASGLLRGTRGGPKMPSYTGELRGDHYDMTTRRILFERAHKSIGYIALASAWLATAAGLWSVNAPLWIWLLVSGWWILLCAIGVHLQMQHRAIDTYQAIWGTHPDLKGNQMTSIGIGVHKVTHKYRQ